MDVIGETEARAILADAFRRAGYRILYDVEFANAERLLAIDGFDPRKKVGYEYIASDEVEIGRVVKAAALESVLVVGPTSREEVIEAAAKFVATLVAAQKE